MNRSPHLLFIVLRNSVLDLLVLSETILALGNGGGVGKVLMSVRYFIQNDAKNGVEGGRGGHYDLNYLILPSQGPDF